MWSSASVNGEGGCELWLNLTLPISGKKGITAETVSVTSRSSRWLIAVVNAPCYRCVVAVAHALVSIICAPATLFFGNVVPRATIFIQAMVAIEVRAAGLR